MSPTPERDALRAECAGNGFHCPSCLTNWADLPDRHMLLMQGGTARCGKGEPVDLAAVPFETLQFAAKTNLFDSYRRTFAGFGDVPGLHGF